MIKIIAVFLIMFSGSVFADTYPAEQTITYSGFPSPDAYCAANYAGAWTAVIRTTDYGCRNPDNPADIRQGSNLGVIVYSCPYGGSLSGSSCVNVPACVAPTVRNSTTGACTVPEGYCKYPEIWDSLSMACRVPECPASQKFNYLMLACAPIPACGSTEVLKETASGFTCYLAPLNCPLNSHASSQNDSCLPDPPRGCPPGQHDDGSYTCIANDAPAPCTGNQVRGWINGQPQCVALTRPSESAAKSDAAAAAAAAAKTAAAAAKTAADAAAAASAADPTNQQKTDDAAAAKAASDAANSNAANKQSDADAAQKAVDSAALKSIAENAQLDKEARLSRSGESSTCDAQPTCSGDAINCAILFQTWHAQCDGLPTVAPGDIPEKDLLTPAQKSVSDLDGTFVGGSCPAPQSFSAMGHPMTLSFQPLCTYAEGISYIVIASAWLFAGFIVFGAKV